MKTKMLIDVISKKKDRFWLYCRLRKKPMNVKKNLFTFISYKNKR